MHTTPVPASFTPADVEAVKVLCDQLATLVQGLPGNVALSALLTSYMRCAERNQCVVGAAEQIVQQGGAILLGLMLKAAEADATFRTSVTPSPSSAMH